MTSGKVLFLGPEDLNPHKTRRLVPRLNDFAGEIISVLNADIIIFIDERKRTFVLRNNKSHEIGRVGLGTAIKKAATSKNRQGEVDGNLLTGASAA